MLDAMTRRRSGTMRTAGWFVLVAGLLWISAWVVANAIIAGDDFQKWVGWANVLALPTSAVGVVLVIFDRTRASRDESPMTMNVVGNDNSVVYGVMGSGGIVINAEQPDPDEGRP
jgi:hypothetical protein